MQTVGMLADGMESGRTIRLAGGLKMESGIQLTSGSR